MRISKCNATSGLSRSLLGAALLFAACRGTGTTDDPTADLSVPPSAADLAQTPATETTIRSLNALSGVKVGDRVKISGVAISPFMWSSADDNATGNDFCNYRIVLMHADGSAPTRQDGMVITIGLSLMFANTDMSKLTQCSDLGKKNSVVVNMDAVMPGDLVEVEGRFGTLGTGGPRQIDVFNGSVTAKGQSPMQPTPLTEDPALYIGAPSGMPTPKSFIDANGVLVKFDNVRVNSRDATFQDFVVNTTMTSGATIATNYLRARINNYMSPAVNTTLQSVTGIVFSDFRGTIWARTAADVKP